MIEAGPFIAAAASHGVGMWTGVPCSYLKPFINHVIADPDVQYVAAANEGDAVAIAAGAHLGGTTGLVMFQNSGLGNAVNPLTSLALTHRIPMLIVVTLRADPAGRPDEPQHTLMGRITPSLLELIGISWEYFPTEDAGVGAALDRAFSYLTSTSAPYAFVMREGSVAPVASPQRGSLGIVGRESRPAPRLARKAPSENSEQMAGPRMERADVIRVLHESEAGNSAVIATTGFTGRELAALDDRPNQFYLVGAMGCASSVGLGLALSRPDVRVTVLDGDGAALMRLGALATIGAYSPPNLTHILLDNGLHESTGGQETVADAVDFVGIAAGCGYQQLATCDSADGLRAAIDHAVGVGPSFIHVDVSPGVMADLPRPERGPAAVAETFKNFFAVESTQGSTSQ